MIKGSWVWFLQTFFKRTWRSINLFAVSALRKKPLNLTLALTGCNNHSIKTKIDIYLLIKLKPVTFYKLWLVSEGDNKQKRRTYLLKKKVLYKWESKGMILRDSRVRKHGGAGSITHLFWIYSFLQCNVFFSFSKWLNPNRHMRR